VYNRVERLLAAAQHRLVRALETWVDRVTEVCDIDQVVEGARCLLLRLGVDQAGYTLFFRSGQFGDNPRRVGVSLELSTRGQVPHLVPDRDRSARQCNRFGHVPLEVQPELASAGERLDVPAELFGRVRVAVLDAGQERSEFVA